MICRLINVITVGALVNLADDHDADDDADDDDDDDDDNGLHDRRVHFTFFKLANRTAIGPLFCPTLFR